MKPLMLANQTCSKCGASIPAGHRGRVCPVCVLQHALEDNPISDAPTLNTISEGPGPDLAGATGVISPAARSFGDYELLEEIARGGMGIVYKARQRSLDRLVAIKMILGGSLASKHFIHRFRTEAAAAASLQHPNIVAVHEVGAHEGENFLVMDFVDGPNLAHLVGQQPLPAWRAARYMTAVAEAIHYAHERAILHRDLKPSNILIGSDDQPRVTDFGLAKRLEKETELTLSGQVLGSPNYMAPEQASGKRGQVGKRSDVYSLGAILYHLLTARPPFQADTVTDTLQEVLNAEPVPPRLLNHSVPADLETICLKCLEKEPEKRYHAAKDVAEELNRFLDREPILARPVTRAERLWRWCQRKPLVASLSAATAALLLAVAVGSPIATFRIAAAREATRHSLYAADMREVQNAWQDGDAKRAIGLLRAHRPTRGQGDLRGFEWRYFWTICQGQQAAAFYAQKDEVGSVAFGAGAKTIVCAGRRGTVKLWDLTSQQEIATLPKRWAPPVALSPDGQLLASNLEQSGFAVYQVKSGQELTELWNETDLQNLYYGVDALAFSLDGRRVAIAAVLVAAGRVSQVTVLDVATKQRGTEFGLLPQKIFALAFSPDGRTLAAGGALGFFTCRDFETGRELICGSLQKQIDIRSLAFSSDGKLIAVAQGKSVTLLRVPGEGIFGSFTTEKSEETSQVAFSPDGQWLAIGTSSGVIEVVQPAQPNSQRRFRRLMGHTELVTSLAFSADSRTLLSGSLDKSVRLWDFSEIPHPEVLRGHSTSVSAVAIASDSRTMASGGADGVIRLWDAVTLREIAKLPGHAHEVRSLAFSQNRDYLVSASGIGAEQGALLEPGDAKLWDLQKRAEVALLEGLTNCARSAAFSPTGDGTFAIAAPYAAELWSVWSLSALEMAPGRQRNSGERVTAVAFSPDGQTLAVGSRLQTIELWNVAARKPRGELTGSKEGVECLSFSPNGELLAAGSSDLSVKIWDVNAQRLVASLAGHKALTVSSVSFSPDGRTLASAGGDGTVRLWSVAAKRELLTLTSDADKVSTVAFAADGKILVSGNADGTIKLWRAPTFDETDTPGPKGAKQ